MYGPWTCFVEYGRWPCRYFTLSPVCPIGEADEIPEECGVMIAEGERLSVARNAPKRSIPDLPFAMWMALAKATPMLHANALCPEGPSQSMLQEDGDD